MRIYTRSGDDGSTGLYGGGRVWKCDVRIEAVGAVDELNAQLGVVRALKVSQRIDDILATLQNRMFDLGAELGSSESAQQQTEHLGDADVSQLERWIDEFDSQLPALQTFILPGGSPGASALHLARSMCRRAERSMVELFRGSSLREVPLQYINRVGDLLFVLARLANAELGLHDTPWQKSP